MIDLIVTHSNIGLIQLSSNKIRWTLIHFFKNKSWVDILTVHTFLKVTGHISSLFAIVVATHNSLHISIEMSRESLYFFYAAVFERTTTSPSDVYSLTISPCETNNWEVANTWWICSISFWCHWISFFAVLIKFDAWFYLVLSFN